MTPAISQVCTLETALDDEIPSLAACEFRSLELWLTKVEQFIQTHSVEHVLGLLAEHQMTAPVASYQGGLLTSQGERRREAWELLKRRLELCQQLGVKTLVVACDIPPPLGQSDIEQAQASLLELAHVVGSRSLRAALELQKNAALGNNLQSVAALVAEVGSPHLGLCLDVFQYYVGPSKPEDLEYLDTSNLFHVQLADLADVPRELATDADRILPGDGDIDFRAIMARLRQIQYDGLISVELMNPRMWQIPARQVAEVAMSALQKVMPAAD